MSATRAATIAGPRLVEMSEVAVEPCGAGDIAVAVEGCGVCGSNLPVWEGRPWFEYPLAPGAPGHEAWGYVDDVGDGTSGLRRGQRVAFLADRAFAEAVVVPASLVVPVPASVDGDPFPGEALGCGFNVAARSAFGAGQVVAVVGIGFLGAIVVAEAVAAGAHVIALSRRPFALETARLMGAQETLELGESADVVRAVSASTGGKLCDVVVEAVGVQSTLDLAGELTKVRGRLVIAGFHQDGPRTVNVQLWNWRGIDVINAHERDPLVSLEGMKAAAAAIDGGRFDPRPLYTHAYPLDRLGDAMDAMTGRPDGFLKAVVRV
ncbi:MAG: threonine dehydrogenase [Acidimicrobiia bacterium]|nr:threonine dehydrogenase [Acidimicrobiia bacterium]